MAGHALARRQVVVVQVQLAGVLADQRRAVHGVVAAVGPLVLLELFRVAFPQEQLEVAPAGEIDGHVVLVAAVPVLARVGQLEVEKLPLAVAVDPDAQRPVLVQVQVRVERLARPGPGAAPRLRLARGRQPSACPARLDLLGGAGQRAAYPGRRGGGREFVRLLEGGQHHALRAVVGLHRVEGLHAELHRLGGKTVGHRPRAARVVQGGHLVHGVVGGDELPLAAGGPDQPELRLLLAQPLSDRLGEVAAQAQALVAADHLEVLVLPGVLRPVARMDRLEGHGHVVGQRLGAEVLDFVGQLGVVVAVRAEDRPPAQFGRQQGGPAVPLVGPAVDVDEPFQGPVGVIPRADAGVERPGGVAPGAGLDEHAAVDSLEDRPAHLGHAVPAAGHAFGAVHVDHVEPAGVEDAGDLRGHVVDQGGVLVGLEGPVADEEVIDGRPLGVRRGLGAEGPAAALREAERLPARQAGELDQLVVDAHDVAPGGIGPDGVELLRLLRGGHERGLRVDRGGQGETGVGGQALVRYGRDPGVVGRDAAGQGVHAGLQPSGVDLVDGGLEPGQAAGKRSLARLVVAQRVCPAVEVDLGQAGLLGQGDPVVDVLFRDAGEDVGAAVLRRVEGKGPAQRRPGRPFLAERFLEHRADFAPGAGGQHQLGAGQPVLARAVHGEHGGVAAQAEQPLEVHHAHARSEVVVRRHARHPAHVPGRRNGEVQKR